MTSLFLYLLGGLGVLALLATIPGLKHFIEPVLEFAFWLIKVISEHAFAWLVWVCKTTVSDHITLLKQLTHNAEELDITIELRDTEQ